MMALVSLNNINPSLNLRNGATYLIDVSSEMKLSRRLFVYKGIFIPIKFIAFTIIFNPPCISLGIARLESGKWEMRPGSSSELLGSMGWRGLARWLSPVRAALHTCGSRELEIKTPICLRSGSWQPHRQVGLRDSKSQGPDPPTGDGDPDICRHNSYLLMSGNACSSWRSCIPAAKRPGVDRASPHPSAAEHSRNSGLCVFASSSSSLRKHNCFIIIRANVFVQFPPLPFLVTLWGRRDGCCHFAGVKVNLGGLMGPVQSLMSA